MKYYSEKTKQFYETEEKAFEAEREFDEKKAKNAELEETKRIRTEGVEKAFEDAYKLLDEYVKDYGEFTGEIDIPFEVDELAGLSMVPHIKHPFFSKLWNW